MARTVEQIDAEIEALRAQRANPASAVRVGDLGVNYKTEAQLTTQLAALERERARVAGGAFVRAIHVTVDKGY